MNTSPATPASLEITHLEKLRTQISADIETMQQKEASLREYERRLRHLVEQSDSSRPPLSVSSRYQSDSTLDSSRVDAEWEKFNRAHALLEAARRGLCDDRLALKDREERVQRREEEVYRREASVNARVQELEVQFQALAQARAELQPKVAPAPVNPRSFTTAPFMVARNLLSIGRART